MSYTDFDFPHTSLYTSDLREVIANLRRLEDIVKTFVTTEQVKFADPIIWNITSQYTKTTVVMDTSGNAYLSKQAAPSGIQLNNGEYWQEIFNFTDYTRTANQNLTVNVETNTTRATSAYNVDDWLIWNDVLYKVTTAIAIDDTLIVAPDTGSNIIHFTVEDFIKAFMTWATNTINQYKDDIDASESQYRQQLAQDISTTTASLQAQLDAVIAGATVDSEVIDARVGWNNTTYSTLGQAIRTQVSNLHDVKMQGRITVVSSASDDADNMTDVGCYLFNFAAGANAPANTPYGAKWSSYGERAILITNTDNVNYYISQTFIGVDGIWIRTGVNRNNVITWLAWTSEFTRDIVNENTADVFDASAEYPKGKNILYHGDLYNLFQGKAANVTWTNTIKQAEKIGNSFINGRNDLIIGANYDLNNYVKPAAYNILCAPSSTTLPANTPYGNKWTDAGNSALLIVSDTVYDYYVLQTFISVDGVWQRYGVHSNNTYTWLLWSSVLNVNSIMSKVNEALQDANINQLVVVESTDSLLQKMKDNPSNTTFLIKSGVHDIKAEYESYYGSDFFDNYAGYSGNPDLFMRGLWLANGNKLIGETGAEITFSYSGNNDNVKNYFSLLSISVGCEIDNIIFTIGVDECARYHIHDDFAGNLHNTNTIKNCTFKGRQYYVGCIGGGCGTGCKYIIENNVFDNTSLYSVSYHNNATPTPPNNVTIKDNYCNGKIRIAAYGTVTTMSKAVVTGNICNGVELAKTSPSDYDNFDLYHWNNEQIS